MATERYATFGLFAIFISFAGGVAFAFLSVLAGLFGNTSKGTANRTAITALVLGLTLVGGAVLLYLIYGCVFGCPG